MGKYDNWSTGSAVYGNEEFQTLHPPKVERKDCPLKDTVIYRDVFMLRPIYQIRDRAGERMARRFLGYQLTMRTSDHYWKEPRTLAEVKKHADKVLEAIQASNAIARTMCYLVSEPMPTTQELYDALKAIA